MDTFLKLQLNDFIKLIDSDGMTLLFQSLAGANRNSLIWYPGKIYSSRKPFKTLFTSLEDSLLNLISLVK